MHFFGRYLTLALVLLLAWSPAAQADVDKDKDKDKNRAKQEAIERLRRASFAKVGGCEAAKASANLDVNNVNARLFNNGGLFWVGGQHIYEVPKGSGVHSIFASGIWVGGETEAGVRRVAAATYHDWEFWAGSYEDGMNGTCGMRDRMWKVSRADIDAYLAGETPTADIADWPAAFGAPVADGDGNPDNYNLAGGDLPGIIGDQSIWWVMNDVGNIHATTLSDPLGLEVQAMAFAFDQSGPLGNTTFYKYKFIYKGDSTLTNVYLGLWSDPDLGFASDDYVGSDSVLGLGFVFNGDQNDEGAYQNSPPALGYDFFQGPLVDSDGVDNNGDGEVDEPGERIGMQRFVFYNNDSTPQGNPGTASEYYNYLRGVWRDNVPITFGGSGRGFSSDPAAYMYPADPPRFWSEDNTDAKGTRNRPDDRRFIQSAGPFTLNPGDEQEIVFGIVWSQSVSRLASVAQLKLDDIIVQGAFDLNFNIPDPPSAPDVRVVEDDGQVTLSWTNAPASNNYLDQYEAPSPFLASDVAPDTTMNFEGYIVYEYTSLQDQTGRVVAVYDQVNAVDVITGPGVDFESGGVVTQVLVPGRDQGVQHSHTVTGSIYSDETQLRNYTSYYFGVQAYAYNAFSQPQVYRSPIRRVTVEPGKLLAAAGGTSQVAELSTRIDSERTTGIGDPPGVFATVADPTQVTGATYSVSIKDVELNDSTSVLGYDVRNDGTGNLVVDGAAFVTRAERQQPFGNNLLVADGLEFSIGTAPPSFKNFLATANGAGPIDPPTGAAADFQGFPVPERPGGSQQVGEGAWMIATGDNGARGSFEAFLDRVSNGGAWAARKIVPYDFEIRFTEAGGTAYDPFCTGEVFPVPFELWRIGIDTPDDPSDDVRMVPYVLDNDFSAASGVAPAFNLNSDWSLTQAAIQFFGDYDGDGDIDAADGACAQATADHSGSSLTNDPTTDWIYFATPTDESPGDAGYLAWEAQATSVGVGYGELATDNSIRRMVLFNWNGGDVCPALDANMQCTEATYDQDMPEVGTVFRLVTTKPLAAGDVFAINTSQLVPVTDQAQALRDALELTTVVPNPYLGASAYEVSRVTDEVRITNLPEQATIRVFTLNGTLIRTLEKNSPARFIRWDLNTEERLPIASGIYLIHIETKDSAGGVVGSKVLKFAAVKKRVQLQEF